MSQIQVRDLYWSNSIAFYAPGSSYHIFAGHEASVSLAKGDLSGNYLNKYKEVELDEREEAGLEDWF